MLNVRDIMKKKEVNYFHRKEKKNKEKVWCDCCRTEVRRDGWGDHLASYQHRHCMELEEGDVMRQEGTIWCESCRVLISTNCFSKHKKSKEHQRLLNLMNT